MHNNQLTHSTRSSTGGEFGFKPAGRTLELFRQFKSIYGHKLTSSSRKKIDWAMMMYHWEDSLKRFDNEEVFYALNESKRLYNFIPSIAEFIGLCEQERNRKANVQSHESLRLEGHRRSSPETAKYWLNEIKQKLKNAKTPT